MYIFLGGKRCLESNTLCLLQYYLMYKLQNSQMQYNQMECSTYHTDTPNMQYITPPAPTMRQWTGLAGLMGISKPLALPAGAQHSSYCFSVCWWPRPLITHRVPTEAINCSDEMKSLCSSSPPLLPSSQKTARQKKSAGRCFDRP